MGNKASSDHKGAEQATPINDVCPICSTPGARTAYSLPRFDLLVCSHCTHLFSNLKVTAGSFLAVWLAVLLEVIRRYWVLM